MAYINKNDFSIVGYIDNYILADDYFECDDLIAPAISLLNKKGYKTEFCCSGHPFAVIDSCALAEYPSDEQKEKMNLMSINPSKDSKDIPDWVDKEEFPYFVSYLIPYPDCGFYVSFKEIYKFSDLPEDAYIDEDNGGIYWRIEEKATNDFAMVTRIYEFNKAFYEWVEKLPSLI